MDNGLIFPYPRRTAHTEPGDAKHPSLECNRPFRGRHVEACGGPMNQ